MLLDTGLSWAWRRCIAHCWLLLLIDYRIYISYLLKRDRWIEISGEKVKWREQVETGERTYANSFLDLLSGLLGIEVTHGEI